MEQEQKKEVKWRELLDLRDIAHHPAHYSVLLTNLVLLFGLIMLNWSGRLIVAAYFLETIIIGLFNVIKMLMIWKFNPKPDSPDAQGLKGLPVIPFFMFHYGFFIFVQLVVFLGFSSALDPALRGIDGGFIPNLPSYFTRSLGNNFVLIAGNFVIGQVIYFATVFLYNKQYLTTTLDKQMMTPYPRIIVQQLTIIIAGFLLILFQSSNVVAYLLIAFKTLTDIIVIQTELKEGKKASSTFTATNTRF